ncbi:MAG: S8 family serine peptidase [Balneolales bacterium]|nr:S8 family serine peptidase [Balneolales bacterium]
MKAQKKIIHALYATFFAIAAVMIIQIPATFAQENPTAGVLHIKFTDEAVRSMESSGITDVLRRSQSGQEDAQITSGVEDVDAVFYQLRAHHLVPVFTAPERFQARHRQAGLDRWFTLYFDDSLRVEDAAAQLLLQQASIEQVSKDYHAVSHEYIPETSIWDLERPPVISPFSGQFDPEFERQWHFYNSGLTGGTEDADIKLIEAWAITAGSPEVVVQVIDSGIDQNHPDLINMLWVNTVSGQGEHGWNFVSNNSNTLDHSGHGTHVAGTIGAQNANNVGVAGIAGGTGSGDGARLMISRIFEPNPNGGNIGAGANGTAQAIVYGTDHGAVISNNSWGYIDPGVFPPIVREAIDYFIEFAGYDENGNVEGAVAGGVFISSAGNTPNGAFYFPAAYEPVVSVVATDHNDQKSLYSNFGLHTTISAPGGQMFTGNFEGGVYSTDLTSNSNPYSFKHGTSMASPHVAGVAALIASHFPGITNEELISRLVSTADEIDWNNPDYEGMLGSGRVNAYRALTESPAPGRSALLFPENNAENIGTNLTFLWGEAILAQTYSLELSQSAQFEELELEVTGLSETQFGFTGLEEGTAYFWRVKASNAVGDGLWSNTFMFKTEGEPTSATDNDYELPFDISLRQNYPNPFNPTTNISYTLPEASHISLNVYNIAGQRVATLYNGTQQAGTHVAVFDANGLSSGVYIYQLRTNQIVLNRKMMLVK